MRQVKNDDRKNLLIERCILKKRQKMKVKEERKQFKGVFAWEKKKKKMLKIKTKRKYAH